MNWAIFKKKLSQLPTARFTNSDQTIGTTVLIFKNKTYNTSEALTSIKVVIHYVV